MTTSATPELIMNVPPVLQQVVADPGGQRGYLSLVFSQPVTAGSGDMILYGAGGSIVFQASMGKSPFTVSGNTVLVKLPEQLVYSSAFQMALANGFVLGPDAVPFGGLAIDHTDSAQHPFPVVLNGGGSGDTLIGGLAGDVLLGNDGNDRLMGNGGNDLLDGGMGRDSALFGGARAEYVIGLGAQGRHVVTHAAGAVDQLAGIERLVFADRTVALDLDGNGGQVYRLYRAAFDRAPDLAGLGYWIGISDAGASLASLANGFVRSAEFAYLYGAAPGNGALVDRLYEHVLDRGADAAGRAYWVDLLERHVLSAADVLAAFSESAENKAAVAAVVGLGFEYMPYG